MPCQILSNQVYATTEVDIWRQPLTSSLKAYFLPFSFGIYDNLTSDHVPGLQKYDLCMTEQVPGPQGVKIVGRHIASAP